MKNSGTFNLTAHGDREIVVTRVFDAPRRLVFDAYTQPELIKRWLLGPDGWSMPVCEIDLRAAGRYRHVWRNDTDGREMGMGGAGADCGYGDFRRGVVSGGGGGYDRAGRAGRQDHADPDHSV